MALSDSWLCCPIFAALQTSVFTAVPLMKGTFDRDVMLMALQRELALLFEIRIVEATAVESSSLSVLAGSLRGESGGVVGTGRSPIGSVELDVSVSVSVFVAQTLGVRSPSRVKKQHLFAPAGLE